VTVASAPDGEAWTLKATHDGDAISITPIAGPFGSTMWPVWLETTYATTQMKPAVDGQSCDETFGLP
jgi:hypothetical protein